MSLLKLVLIFGLLVAIFGIYRAVDQHQAIYLIMTAAGLSVATRMAVLMKEEKG